MYSICNKNLSQIDWMQPSVSGTESDINRWNCYITDRLSVYTVCGDSDLCLGQCTLCAAVYESITRKSILKLDDIKYLHCRLFTVQDLTIRPVHFQIYKYLYLYNVHCTLYSTINTVTQQQQHQGA